MADLYAKQKLQMTWVCENDSHHLSCSWAKVHI